MSFRVRLWTLGAALGVAGWAAAARVPYGYYGFSAIAAAAMGTALRDRWQQLSPLLRNYPLLGRAHFALAALEDLFGWRSERTPYRLPVVQVIQARAAGQEAVSAFGATLSEPPFHIMHALHPAPLQVVPTHVSIGGPQCSRPYLASFLNVSALAFGALSETAIEALSQAAKLGEFYLCTGEAGMPASFLRGGGDLVWQVGTGYFGCRKADGSFDGEAFRERALAEPVRAIELKLSQGSKPSKGGLLLAAKVTREVADVCQIPMHRDSVLPAQHSAFDSPAGLLQFVARLRELAGGKPVGIKLCVGQAVDLFAIMKAMIATEILPDFISVDGAEGGTGAAPVEFQSYVGMPLRDALPFVSDALVGVGLRDKIKVIASGKIATGGDMVAALALGADLCAAARAFMIALGCIQAMVCASNDCPVGITSHRASLTRGIVPTRQAERVAAFHRATVESFRELVAAAGCSTPSQLGDRHVLQAGARERERLQPRQLLEGRVPLRYRDAWEHAQSDRFFGA